MSLFVATFEAMAVLFTIGGLGFLVLGRRIVPKEAFRFLNPLVLDIALPCLIFTNIITRFRPAEYREWWQLPLWWLAFTAVAGGMTALAVKTCRKEVRPEFAVSLFFQNITFFPLAILTGLFGAGSSYIVDLFLFGMLFPPFLFNTYYLFFDGSQGRFDWRKTFHPVVVVSFVAIAICLADLQDSLPHFLVSSTKLVGQTAVPLIMIVLGGGIYVALSQHGPVRIVEILRFVLFKNVIFPLAVLGILVLVRPAYGVALIIVLESAVPPITSVPLFAERGKGNSALVSQFVVASFLASVVTIPIMVWLFGKYFPAY